MGSYISRPGNSEQTYIFFEGKKDDIIMLQGSENLTNVLWKIMCREFPPLPLLVSWVTRRHSKDGS